MEKILFTYGNPTETVSAITMLYENTKSLVRSPDGDQISLISKQLFCKTIHFFSSHPWLCFEKLCRLHLC